MAKASPAKPATKTPTPTSKAASAKNPAMAAALRLAAEEARHGDVRTAVSNMAEALAGHFDGE